MPVEPWSGRSAGAWCVPGIVAAVLVGGVCQLVWPTLQPLPLAASGSQTTRSPFSLPPTGRVKDLAPGALLVAARGLPDPNFGETVVMLIDHSEEGTAGLVVNRQTDVPLSRVFQELPQAQNQSAPVYLGGPVSITAVQALVRSSKAVPQGRQVTGDIHVIGTRPALEERLASTTDPSRFRVYMGYAGWAPGQLEQEIGAGAWHIVAAEAAAVFDPDPDTLWHRQIRRTESLLARQAPATRPYARRACHPANPCWRRCTGPSKDCVDLNSSNRPSVATSRTRAASADCSAAGIGLKSRASAMASFRWSMVVRPTTCEATGWLSAYR